MKGTRMFENLFTLIDKRYKIDGRKLAQAREAKEMNMSEFAYACDWSPQYQWQLENGRIDSICEATMNVIKDNLK